MSVLPQKSLQKVKIVEVEPDEAGQRIDNFLMARLKGLPRTRVYRLLRKGEVRVNKGRVKPKYKIVSGDLVRIPPVFLPDQSSSSVMAPPAGLSAQLLQSIIYESDEWMVVDKPSNLAVHGGSGQSFGLIESMRHLRSDCRFLELCHRIDKDTSGCLVIAKKRSSLKRFHAALRERKLVKKYLALVSGRWPKAIDGMSVPLQKNVLQSGERMVVPDVNGKVAKTLFSVIEKFEKYTLIEAQPVTGRTHQIRVHAQTAGFPIVGDKKYGIDTVDQLFRDAGFKHLFLHAQSITIPNDDGTTRFVESPMPDTWVSCIAEQLS